MSPPESPPDNVRTMSPRTSPGEMFIARVRLLLQSWEDFEKNVGENNRSAWLKDFVEAFNRQPQVFMDAKRIADRRGEVMWTAVVGPALSRYVARNRHLLDDSEDE